MEALLAAGADPDASTPSGKTIRELAIINKKEKVLLALQAHAETVCRTSVLKKLSAQESS